MFRSPPIGTNKIAIDQAWFRMIKKVTSDFSETGWSNFLFVDGEIGNDTTAKRGSLTYKYKTIQAAMNAAQENDTVWVGTGIYQENLVWPEIAIGLRGMGRGETVVIATTGVALTIAPTALVIRSYVTDISFWSLDGSLAVSIDGSSNPDNLNGLDLFDMYIVQGDVLLSNVNLVNMRSIDSEGDITLFNCGKSQMLICDWKNIEVTYEATPVTEPNEGNTGLIALATLCTGLTVNGVGRAIFGKDTQVSFVNTELVDTATTYGFVWCSGKIATDVNISFTLENGPQEVARLDFAEIGGVVDVTDAGTTGTEIGTVNCRNAILYNTTGPHRSGDLSVLDLRGSQFAQTAIAVDGGGAVDRTNWYIHEAQGSGAGGVNISIAIPYPTGKNDYTVLCDTQVITDGPIGVDSKLVNQFSRTKTADNGYVRYQLIRPYD